MPRFIIICTFSIYFGLRDFHKVKFFQFQKLRCFLVFGKGGNCKDYQTSSPGKHNINLFDTPFMFAPGFIFDNRGWNGHIQGVPILEPQRSYVKGGGGCGIINPFSVKDPKTSQDFRMSYIPLNMYDRTGMATT